MVAQTEAAIRVGRVSLLQIKQITQIIAIFDRAFEGIARA